MGAARSSLGTSLGPKSLLQKGPVLTVARDLVVLPYFESTSDSVGHTLVEDYSSSLESLAALHSPDHELQWLAIAWLCFALDCHWNFVGRYFVTAELFHAFDLN